MEFCKPEAPSVGGAVSRAANWGHKCRADQGQTATPALVLRVAVGPHVGGIKEKSSVEEKCSFLLTNVQNCGIVQVGMVLIRYKKTCAPYP